MIDPSRLWPGETVPDSPLVFVDLDRADVVPADLQLPPCPIIGIGDPTNPIAIGLDATIEHPISADAIVRQVVARPHAAAVIVQLLRILPAVSPEIGLDIESMAYGLLQGSEEHRGWLSAQRRQVPSERTPGTVTISRDGDRLHVTLDHEASDNSIDRSMRDALYEAFSLAALDPDIARVSLRGRGRTFSLGAELAEFGTTTDPATAHSIRGLTLPARALVRISDKLDVHVQGGCVGSGLEMAAWGKHVTASPDAWFQLPELEMGILPGAGGCVSLTRRIGQHRTALMILSGKRISARQALGWGLVDAIVDEPPGE